MITNPFADIPVIGAMPPAMAVAKLRELGEDSAAVSLDGAVKKDPVKFAAGSSWWPFDRIWKSKAHAFGFIPATGKTTPGKIMNIGNIPADLSLKNSRIKIALNYLRVADYPGFGTHNILIDFYARNQVPGQAEDLHFNATYRVPEGERAPIVGYPIFVGLNVGAEGVAFRCLTVNVKNDADEAFLHFLEGDVFKAGLKLATSAQPAMAPLSNLALGITKSIAGRNRNVGVQEFYLGLDFAGTRMGARLAIGDYVAVQIPEKSKLIWNWEDWVYDPNIAMIVAKNDLTQLIPYNYLVFGVSRYEGN